MFNSNNAPFQQRPPPISVNSADHRPVTYWQRKTQDISAAMQSPVLCAPPPPFHVPDSSFVKYPYGSSPVNAPFYPQQQSIPHFHSYSSGHSQYPGHLGLSLTQPPPPPQAPSLSPRAVVSSTSLNPSIYHYDKMTLPTVPVQPAIPPEIGSGEMPGGTRVGDGINSSVLLRCSPCDKSFSSQKSYDAHVSTHDKCLECSFEGTKKVVAAHFQSTHGAFSGNGYKRIEVEGLQFKVLMGTDPDEVAEWRTQRRKKFPTRQLCEEKQVREQLLLREGGLASLQEQNEMDDVACRKKRSVNAIEAFREENGGLEGKKPKLVDDRVPIPCTMSTVCTHSIGADDVSSGKSSVPVTRVDERTTCATFKRKGRCKFGSKCRFKHSIVAPGVGDVQKTRGEKSRCRLTSLHGELIKHDIEIEDNLILQCFRHFIQTNFAVGKRE